MASINFVDGATIIPASWANDVDESVYGVKSFGAVGDGVSDDTLAVQTAINSATAAGKRLYFPAGTYLCGSLTAVASMSLFGDGPNSTTIKLKNGTNATLVTSPSTNITDVTIRGIKFDGNRANNTSGDILNIYGSRSTLEDLIIINAPQNGIQTDWNPASGERSNGCEGFFSHITIDSCGRSGWIHRGPSDSHFEAVIINDCGLSLTNTYYHLFLATGAGNGRFFNCHTWNRSVTTTVATVAVYVQSNGNTFSGCHFEGGNTSCSIVGNNNIFEGGAIYAPRSTYALQLIGASNRVSGNFGINAFAGNPNYIGCLLTGVDNDLLMMDGGCINGSVEFSGGEVQNRVNVRGNRSGTGYVGTPSTSDDVSIVLGGGAATTFYQHQPNVWSQTTPTPTAASGTFTSATALVRYRQDGKTVHIQALITITTNGTAAGHVVLPLPVTASVTPSQVLTGRDRGLGPALAGAVTATNVQIFKYDNTYPGANGAQLVISGTYEAA